MTKMWLCKCVTTDMTCMWLAGLRPLTTDASTATKTLQGTSRWLRARASATSHSASSAVVAPTAMWFICEGLVIAILLTRKTTRVSDAWQVFSTSTLSSGVKTVRSPFARRSASNDHKESWLTEQWQKSLAKDSKDYVEMVDRNQTSEYV